MLPLARSENVSLAWQPSPSAAAIGYNIYYGVNGSAPSKVDAGNQLTTTVSDLQPGNTYSFYATAYDAAGDESGPSATVTYHVNAPPLASDLAAQAQRNQPLSVTLAGTDPEGDPLTYTIVTLPAHGLLSGTSPNLIYTPAADFVGTDSFTYKVNDGQADSNVATANLSVAEPPDVIPPTVAIASPSGGSTLSGVVTVTVTAIDNLGIARVDLLLNGSLAGTAAFAPASFTWDTRATASGTWSIQAQAYDMAGNVGTSLAVNVAIRNVVPDTTAPVVSITSPAPSSTVAGVVQVQAAADDSVGVTQAQFFVNGTLIATSTSGSTAFAWDTTTFANGVYNLEVRAADAAGNVGTASVTGVTVANLVPDTNAPTVNIISPSSGATLSGIASIAAQAVDGVAVTRLDLLWDDQFVTSAESSSTTFDIDTTTASNGSHSVKVKAYDAAGNAGTASISVKVNNVPPDTTAPTIAITSPKSGATISKNTSVKISASDNAGVVLVELYVDGKLSSSTTSSNPSFTIVASKLSKGPHILTAKAYDAAGNAGTSAPVGITR